jgi:membrane associated rhomboid family serine protease
MTAPVPPFPPDSDPPLRDRHAPPWQAGEVFPDIPATAPYGVVGASGPLTGQDDDDLVARLRRDAERAIALVWTPASPRLVPVGEVPVLAEPLAERDRPFWQRERRSGGMLAVGGLLGVLVTAAFVPPLALLPLFLTMQGAAQALTARQALRTLADPAIYAREQALALRFAAWSGRRPWRGTQILAGALVLIEMLINVVGEGPARVLLRMDPDDIRAGESWRLATAGLIHVNVPHLLINLLALFSLGRLVEALAGWRGMLLAFALGCLAGNALSGLCGLLGWLLIASQPGPGAVPAVLRAAVMRNVWLVALLGVLGAGIIDHVAHVGGLAAGAVLAAVNGRRLPAAGLGTRLGGIAAAFALLATAGGIVWLLLPR